jgi:hypothetical protein
MKAFNLLMMQENEEYKLNVTLLNKHARTIKTILMHAIAPMLLFGYEFISIYDSISPKPTKTNITPKKGEKMNPKPQSNKMT